MSIIIAFSTLLMFQLLGEVTVRLLSLPLPGPLAGMLLLFFALVIHKKTYPALDKTSNFLIQHLMLLFIPAVAGVILFFDRLKEEWLPFLVSGVFGTLITLLVTAYCLLWLLKFKKNQNKQHDKHE